MKKILWIYLAVSVVGIGVVLLGWWGLPVVAIGGLVAWKIWSGGQSKGAWLASVDACQFKHFASGTGLALDTGNRVLHLKEGKNEKSYPFSDIRTWSYNISTGGGIIGTPGLHQAGAVIGHNLRNDLENKRATGFFVEVRDIDNPKWRIVFGGNKEKQFLRWMEIFKQHVNNE